MVGAGRESLQKATDLSAVTSGLITAYRRMHSLMFESSSDGESLRRMTCVMPQRHSSNPRSLDWRSPDSRGGRQGRSERVTRFINSANSFELVALEYIEEKMVRQSLAEATLRKAHRFLDFLRPAIGAMPITEVDSRAEFDGIDHPQRKRVASGRH